MTRPLAIDLFAGLGGWTDGLLAEGYDVIGFDIEQHVYGEHRYPAQLVVQDVLTLHGSQFREAALIVASPPCQEFSYMAMPWSLAKAKAAAIRADKSGEALSNLTRLFDACFRIQREASEAAGRRIPLVVENVRGAQPWVGKARWNFGSFYLWGDVPALMPPTFKGLKVPGFRFDGNGGSFQTASVNGIKGVPHRTKGHWTNPAEHEGFKQNAPAAFESRQRPGMSENSGGNFWFQEGSSRHGSKSPARKAASAMIANIPLPLSRWIAATYRPDNARAAA